MGEDPTETILEYLLIPLRSICDVASILSISNTTESYLVVGETVSPHETHIIRKIEHICILFVVKLILQMKGRNERTDFDCGQIHGILHNFRIIEEPQLLPLHRLPEIGYFVMLIHKPKQSLASFRKDVTMELQSLSKSSILRAPLMSDNGWEQTEHDNSIRSTFPLESPRSRHVFETHTMEVIQPQPTDMRLCSLLNALLLAVDGARCSKEHSNTSPGFVPAKRKHLEFNEQSMSTRQRTSTQAVLPYSWKET